MKLPFFSGNALRGTLRGLLASHFLESMGNPKVSLWFFNVLHSGGTLDEGSNGQIVDALGSHGTASAKGIHLFRDMLPGVSLLGAALGNRIISGRLTVGDLRPRCKEWGTGKICASELFDWHFSIRLDHNAEYRSSSEAHRGGYIVTEVLKTGAILDGGVTLSSHASPLEKGALHHGLKMLQESGRLGGARRQGMGGVNITINEPLDPSIYTDYLTSNKEQILEYLLAVGALDLKKDTSDAPKTETRGRKKKIIAEEKQE